MKYYSVQLCRNVHNILSKLNSPFQTINHVIITVPFRYRFVQVFLYDSVSYFNFVTFMIQYLTLSKIQLQLVLLTLQGNYNYQIFTRIL